MDLGKLFRCMCLLLVCSKAWEPRVCGDYLGPCHEGFRSYLWDQTLSKSTAEQVRVLEDPGVCTEESASNWAARLGR